MKILVLGAGIVGVTTAHALGRLGHEVLVIDQADSVASQASHANGAQLAYSYVDPFANLATLKNIPKYMLGRDGGIRLRLAKNLSYYMWGLEFLRNCTPEKTKANMQVMLEHAQRSKEAMERLCSEVSSSDLSDSELQGGAILAKGAGKIILARNSEEMQKFNESAELKKSYGFDVEMLDKAGCIKREPALSSWRGEFCGGIFALGDKVLDPLAFCKKIQTISETKFKVKYHFGQKIIKLVRQNNEITNVQTDKEMFNCDAVITCLGSGANKVLKTVGKKFPIYPMRGYSLTLPTTNQLPKMSITDPIRKIVFSNLGDEIRIAGFLDANLPEAKIDLRGLTLLDTAQNLWPDIANYDGEDNLWSGLRPMTPSGIPIVKASSIGGLYYNIGHGSLGLTLAMGSAEHIAQLVGQSLRNSSAVGVEKKHVLAS